MAARTDLRALTLDRIEGVIRRNIKPALGNIALADLRRMMIQEWASSLSQDQSAASVRKILNTLSGALQMAVDDGRIPTNPASRLKLPKVEGLQEVSRPPAGTRPCGGGRRTGERIRFSRTRVELLRAALG